MAQTMTAYGEEAFSSAADKMRRQAMIDPKWAQIELHTIVEALHNGLPAFLPRNQAQLSDFNFWLDLQRKAAKMFGVTNSPISKPAETVSSGRIIRESSQDLVFPAPVVDPRLSDDITKHAVAAITTADLEDGEHSDVSDAISDTSFTPPKNLGRFAQIGNDGRRHVVLPPQLTDRGAKQQRFLQQDNNGRQHLLPPPGFHDAAPKPVKDLEPEPSKLTFERKRDFKKPVVACSELSLALKAERALRGDKTKEKKKKKKSRSAGKRPDIPDKHVSSNCQPNTSATTDGKTPYWESMFLKGLFEREEELLYNGRWPVSTF
ncbi:hypothetical protein F5Y12DRAFT_800690 [Xylaria sp. FL1777]|nr:hypothetical protein F5Y12DRAFT_800690 [Xylaria sp. FL1777]